MVVVILHPLCSRLPLQLGKRHNDVQHRPPHGGASVELFCHRNECNTVLLQHLPHAAEVHNRATEAVQTVDKNALDCSILNPFHQRLKAGTVRIFSGETAVLKDQYLPTGQFSAEVDLRLNRQAV